MSTTTLQQIAAEELAFARGDEAKARVAMRKRL
jgi:hypothetical protein